MTSATGSFRLRMSFEPIRLFCFPHAGGGYAAYRSWEMRLPREIEVVPICLPGREFRFGEPPLRAIAPVVEDVLRNVGHRLRDRF